MPPIRCSLLFFLRSVGLWECPATRGFCGCRPLVPLFARAQAVLRSPKDRSALDRSSSASPELPALERARRESGGAALVALSGGGCSRTGDTPGATTTAAAISCGSSSSSHQQVLPFSRGGVVGHHDHHHHLAARPASLLLLQQRQPRRQRGRLVAAAAHQHAPRQEDDAAVAATPPDSAGDAMHAAAAALTSVTAHLMPPDASSSLLPPPPPPAAAPAPPSSSVVEIHQLHTKHAAGGGDDAADGDNHTTNEQQKRQQGAGAGAAAATPAPPDAPAGEPPPPPPPPHPGHHPPRRAQRLLAFAVDNFMPLAFTLAAALAMAAPAPGKLVAGWSVGDVRIVQALNNAAVFLISGLTLKSDDFRALLKQWPGVAYGLFGILALTPTFAFAVLRLPFTPREFAVGLALFCVVPTTLGVGVALTAAAKGNQALALLLTVATNLLGIVTVPYTLKLVLSTAPATGAAAVAGGASVSVDPGSLVVKLLLTVLVPTVVGKLARDLLPPVARFVARHKTKLSMLSTLNLAMIVWQTVSGARDVLLRQPFASVVLVVVAVSALHVAMLVINSVAARALKFPFREAVAVTIMASQKSAPVAVTVISYLTPDLVLQGLLAIPCVLGQLAQIFIGSGVVRLARRMDAAKAT